MDKASNPIRLRPHHIFCIRFLEMIPDGRGEAFSNQYQEIRTLLASGEALEIEIIDAIDEICGYCSDCNGYSYISPFDDEEQVNRWDNRLITALGLKFGNSMTCEDLRKLVDEKAPLEFCINRCPWKSICLVSA